MDCFKRTGCGSDEFYRLFIDNSNSFDNFTSSLSPMANIAVSYGPRIASYKPTVTAASCPANTMTTLVPDPSAMAILSKHATGISRTSATQFVQSLRPSHAGSSSSFHSSEFTWGPLWPSSAILTILIQPVKAEDQSGRTGPATSGPKVKFQLKMLM